jgi:hypothetical protein
MENTLQKIEGTQLERVVNESGLAIQEGEEIKQSYLPFLNQLAEVQDQATKINFENPTSLDENIARELRLKTVKIRTVSSDLKDSRKKTYLLRGNLEQAAYNLIAASCKLAEDTFLQVEKAREIAEAKRKMELKIAREIEAQQYSEFIPFGIDLGNLDETGYQNLLNGAKLQFNAKIEAEKKAEAERVEKERITKLHLERKESILHLWNFATEFEKSLNFGEQSDTDFNNFTERLTKAKKSEDERHTQIKAENERLRKENEAKEKQRLFELAEAEKLRQKAELKAKQEREAAEEKARIEREKAAEIQRKQQIEIQRQKDEIEARKTQEAAELLRKSNEEKKAADAPDKEKIIASVNAIKFELPVCKSDQMQAIANTINEKFENFKKWAILQTENI